MLQSYTLEGFKSIRQRTEVDLRKHNIRYLRTPMSIREFLKDVCLSVETPLVKLICLMESSS